MGTFESVELYAKKPGVLPAIVIGGVVVGVALRKYGRKNSVVSTPTTSTTGLATDINSMGLAGSSTGNLGVNIPTLVDPTTTRDVGTITFPVVKWVVTIDGRDYLTDGVTLTSINGPTNSTTGLPPVSTTPTDPSATPTTNPVPVVSDTMFLTSGSTGDNVKRLQRFLNVVAGRSLVVDGIYGPVTAKAVSDYQRFFNLSPTGTVSNSLWQQIIYIASMKGYTL